MKKSKSSAHDERFRSNRMSESLAKKPEVQNLVAQLQTAQQVAEMESTNGRVHVVSVWRKCLT